MDLQYPSLSRPLFNELQNRLETSTAALPESLPLTASEASRRHKYIQCPRETAVFTKADGNKHYLHGNTFNNYILTQAPTEEAFPTFWKICFEQSQLIVDLTNHGFEFVDEYLTEKGYNDEKIAVTILDKKNDTGSQTTIYKLKITDKATNKEKTIHRINYYGWQDNRPATPQALSKLIEKVDNLAGEEKVIIHCRIGVGRTGTFVTAREIDKLIKEKKIFDPNSLIDETLKIVLAGRQARNPLFVQNEDQLHSIFEFGRWKLEGDQTEQDCTPGTLSTDFLSLPPASTPRDASMCSDATEVFSQQKSNSTSVVP